APVDVALLHLEVGDAVAQQPAGFAVLLVDVDIVAGPRQLLRAREARRPRSDDGDLLAGLFGVDLRLDPAFFPALVDNGAFDRLDGDGRLDDVDRAARLAGCGADAAGELREIVGRVEVAERLHPVAPVDEVVPVGDLVVHRTAGVAIRHPAIHAARRLL